jgi:hypothetical protein
MVAGLGAAAGSGPSVLGRSRVAARRGRGVFFCVYRCMPGLMPSPSVLLNHDREDFWA